MVHAFVGLDGCNVIRSLVGAYEGSLDGTAIYNS